MTFTGAFFERIISMEPPKQIDSIAELIASDIKIITCYVDSSFYEYRSDNYSKNPNVFRRISVGEIEYSLMKREIRFAFVLPETIADIVHHPALQYANGTPVYHIVAEPYSNDRCQF